MGREDLAYAIREALAQDPEIRSPRLRVSWLEDAIVLSGEVDNLEVKNHAEQVARRLAPQFNIDNSLTVAMNRPRSDLELTRLAQEVLAADPDIPQDLGVKVENGIALIMGSSQDLASIQRAEHLLAKLPGIRGVHRQATHLDRILIADTAYDLDDQSVLDEIAKRLGKLDPPLDRRVTVRVNNGVAHLYGEVLSSCDRIKAEREAYRVPTIRRVFNRLDVYDGTITPDENAQAHIRARIGKPCDDATTGYIGVMVEGNTAYLYGVAEKPEGRDQAEHLARKEPGIQFVVNDIKVMDRQKA